MLYGPMLPEKECIGTFMALSSGGLVDSIKSKNHPCKQSGLAVVLLGWLEVRRFSQQAEPKSGSLHGSRLDT